MNIDIATIIRLILYCVPFVGMCIVSTKMNLPKEQRYKQVFLPLIAVIYCVVAVVYLNNISDTVLGAIYWLTDRFRFLSFLQKINWAHASIFIVNAALVSGFMVVKGVLFPALMGIALIPKVSDFTSGLFYYVAEEDKKLGKKEPRYIKNKFSESRFIFKLMFYAMLFLFVFLLIITYYMTSYKVLSAPFYPAFGIIVLGEIVSFLSGMTYEEKQQKDNPPVEESVVKEVDYDILPSKYSDLFTHRLLQTANSKSISDIAGSANPLILKYKKEYETTLCHEAGLMYAYYNPLASKGVVFDEGFLRQTRNILDGKSVLFFTQFYNDTTDYVFLPVTRTLMRSKRILVVLGCSGDVDNIKQWFYNGLSSINGFDKIWNVDLLSNADEDTSILVLESKNIYNQKLLSDKAFLLEDVSMVFIFEPNQLLGTLQIGLSCLVSYLRHGGNDPQYIIYERNCDGLVDSLSHVLNKSIVQVNATSVGSAKKNMLFWKADGSLLHHKLGLTSSRYLGVGTELALVALKENVSNAVWASSRKFPVIDMRWIASQYYSSLCSVANLNISQDELDEHLKFVNDLWAIPKSENSFMVVEDEYNNAFEIARQFSTRGEKQSFVNVISQNYWLRDYMTDNLSIFKQDPKSIPTITADYQRSASNTVYKLIMRMIEGPVEEGEIRDTLEILGEDSDHLYKSMRYLILKYLFRVSDVDAEKEHFSEKIDNAITMTTKVIIDPNSLRSERKRFYCINNKSFVNNFLSQLKIVYYIAEDEKDKGRFLESAMYGHVYQKYLPGMFITLDGKYYEVISMTKNNGIIVRRASDHISSRHYYRTLRKYTLVPHNSRTSVGSKHTYGGITIEHVDSNITVDTFGYLDMLEYSNIKNAKRVELSNVESREYRNKECIKITLANSTQEIRVTLATLLNELFVTIFPDSHQYIVATTKCDRKDDIQGLIPDFACDDEESIYIIEDSLIDLGLLIVVNRYFVRLMQIICDSLNWHQEKLTEENQPDDEGQIFDNEPDEPEKPQKPKNIWDIIKGFFRGKKKKKEEDTVTESLESNGSYVVSKSKMSMSGGLQRNSEPDDSGISGDDSESVGVSELSASSDEKIPYSKSFFLLYGYEAVPSVLNLEATENYLTEQGFADNYLKQTRNNNKHKELKWYNYHFEAGTHYCDFCGKVLDGEYDVLDDGRERCLDCSKESVTKLKDFKKIYKKTRKEMEKIFGIKLKSKITIKTCNAQKIAEQLGETFAPTPNIDGRTLGFAYRYGGDNDIYIENGAPAIETAKTLIHEMTHIWQYTNLPDLFGDQSNLPISEGMAVWAEIQYLTSIGLKERAYAYASSRLMQNNEYGNGLRMYLEKYPIRNKETVHTKTPFNCTRNPLL